MQTLTEITFSSRASPIGASSSWRNAADGSNSSAQFWSFVALVGDRAGNLVGSVADDESPTKETEASLSVSGGDCGAGVGAHSIAAGGVRAEPQRAKCKNNEAFIIFEGTAMPKPEALYLFEERR